MIFFIFYNAKINIFFIILKIQYLTFILFNHMISLSQFSIIGLWNRDEYPHKEFLIFTKTFKNFNMTVEKFEIFHAE